MCLMVAKCVMYGSYELCEGTFCFGMIEQTKKKKKERETLSWLSRKCSEVSAIYTFLTSEALQTGHERFSYLPDTTSETFLSAG